MKKIVLIIVIVVLFFASIAKAGDTGTYEILDYQVKLTPHSDGIVEIGYYQKWKVTGGHIPWVTVGVPNANFKITESGKAVRKISSASGGVVRIDLDVDYQPGAIFEVSFKIDQNNLFYADDNNYQLEFTPGWYDRAFINHLTITARILAKLESVKAEPKPSSAEGEELTWQKTNLGKGERFEIKISFPKNYFPKGIAKDKLKKDTGKILLIAIIFIMVVLLIIIFVVWLSGGFGGGFGGGRYYSGGSIYYGGSRGSSGGLSSGGGGGFGGRASSCVCACVSCACACACAGGGGAGCDRKLRHHCPFCKQQNLA